MNSIIGSDTEEDNNPFVGTTHMFASGISGHNEYTDADANDDDTEQELTKQLFGREHGSSLDKSTPYTTTLAESYTIANPSIDNNNNNNDNDTMDYRVIRIVDAGQYRSSIGKYAIGYTIFFNNGKVTRRYSEFHSLRDSLLKLLPTIIIPPIPSKHSIFKYFFNPLGAENDLKIIEKRKRLLCGFLNNCYMIRSIRENIIFIKFLNVEYSWDKVLMTPPLSILPQSNLLAPPLNQTKPSPLHALLPAPTHIIHEAWNSNSSSRDNEDFINHKFNTFMEKYTLAITNICKNWKIMNHTHNSTLSKSFAEFGAYYNAFSLENHICHIHDNDNDDTLQTKTNGFISQGIERVGQAFDVAYVSNELLIYNIQLRVQEPLAEILQISKGFQRINHFRNLKKTQYYIIEKTIQKRIVLLNNLKNSNNNNTFTENVINIQEEEEDRDNDAHSVQTADNDTISQIDADIARINLIEHTLQKNATGSKTLTDTIERLKQKKLKKLTRLDSSSVSRSGSPVANTVANTVADPVANPVADPNPIHVSTSAASLSDETLKEIQKIKIELDKLYDCFELIKKDMQEVNDSVEEEITRITTEFDATWNRIIKDLSQSMLEWCKDSMDSWKLAKSAI